MEDLHYYGYSYAPHARGGMTWTQRPPTPPQAKRRRTVVCALLTFGAFCGLSTALAGFYVRKWYILGPVVAAGLIGVTIALILAYREALVVGSPASSGRGAAAPAPGAAQPNYAATPGAPGPQAWQQQQQQQQVHLMPMYSSEVKVVVYDAANIKPAPSAAALGTPPSSQLQPPQAQQQAQPPAELAGGIDAGALACGWPVDNALGRVDTVPVLVLQPHPLFDASLLPPQPPVLVVEGPPSGSSGEALPPPSSDSASASDGDELFARCSDKDGGKGRV